MPAVVDLATAEHSQLIEQVWFFDALRALQSSRDLELEWIDIPVATSPHARLDWRYVISCHQASWKASAMFVAVCRGSPCARLA